MTAVPKAQSQRSVSNKKRWCAAMFLLFFLHHFHCARPTLPPQSARSIPCESKIAAFQLGTTRFTGRGKKKCPKYFVCPRQSIWKKKKKKKSQFNTKIMWSQQLAGGQTAADNLLNHWCQQSIIYLQESKRTNLHLKSNHNSHIPQICSVRSFCLLIKKKKEVILQYLEQTELNKNYWQYDYIHLNDKHYLIANHFISIYGRKYYKTPKVANLPAK